MQKLRTEVKLWYNFSHKRSQQTVKKQNDLRLGEGSEKRR